MLTSLSLPFSPWKVVGEPYHLATLLLGPLSIWGGKAGGTQMGPAGRIPAPGSPSPALLVSSYGLSNVLSTVQIISSPTFQRPMLTAWCLPGECQPSAAPSVGRGRRAGRGGSPHSLGEKGPSVQTSGNQSSATMVLVQVCQHHRTISNLVFPQLLEAWCSPPLLRQQNGWAWS